MSATLPPAESPSKPYEHTFHKWDADVVLCSANGDHFHVHRVILSQASSVFGDMFLLPQPTNTGGDATTNELPSVDLEESSRTLDHILRYCYPMRRPTLDKLHDVVAVLGAMRKYQMDDLVAETSELLLRHEFAESIEDALVVYDAMWRSKDAITTEGERGLMLARAARQTFRFKLISSHPILEAIAPVALFELMDFRARCIAAAVQVLHRSHDWEHYYAVRWAGTFYEDDRAFTFSEYEEKEKTKTGCFVHYGCAPCTSCLHGPPMELQVDGADAQNRLISIVQDRPCGQALKECAIVYFNDQVLDDCDCPLCATDGVQTMTEVMAHLSDALDKRLTQVPFYRDES